MSDIFYTNYTMYKLCHKPNTKNLGIATYCHSNHVEFIRVNITFESAKVATFRLQEISGNFTCTVLDESTNRGCMFNTTVSAGTNVTIDTLTPNTTYSIRCTGIEDQCVEVHEMFTTNTTCK